MNILGFNGAIPPDLDLGDGHDAAAAIVVDGLLVAAAEEERFTRKKHTGNFPKNAISYCLETAGLKLKDIDGFAFYWNPDLYMKNIIANKQSHMVIGLTGHFTNCAVKRASFDEFNSVFGFDIPAAKRTFVPHHLCHAASSFYCSPFDESAFLIVDMMGEMVSCTYGTANRDGFKILEEIALPSSLGMLYFATTTMLGFTGMEDEYKVMGLAAYGTPDRFRDNFKKLWRPTETGFEFQIDEAAGRAVAELYQHRRTADQPLTQVHQDIAASLQEALHDQIFHLAKVVRARTGMKNLCLSGGVSLNSTANGKLAAAQIFDDIFIQPAANDAGTSVGAAMYEYHRRGGERQKRKFSAYLGPSYDDAQIKAACDKFAAEIEFSQPADVVETTAEMLAGEQVIGWFQGRMEFGPRALGHRSILSDARKESMRDKINRVVKQREMFRPFAPAVLAERAREVFDMAFVRESPYMLMTVPVIKERREEVAAIVHRDGTARVQTVAVEDDVIFHKLLERFAAKTGIPVLLNTSFNVKGEPIVNTPEEAIECLLATEMDALVIGNFVVRPRQTEGAAQKAWLTTKPVLNEGVTIHAGELALGDEGVAFASATVRWRHFAVEMKEDALKLLMKCDGTQTLNQLIDQTIGDVDDDDREEASEGVIALINKLLRVRVLRLLA